MHIQAYSDFNLNISSQYVLYLAGYLTHTRRLKSEIDEDFVPIAVWRYGPNLCLVIDELS